MDVGGISSHIGRSTACNWSDLVKASVTVFRKSRYSLFRRYRKTTPLEHFVSRSRLTRIVSNLSLSPLTCQDKIRDKKYRVTAEVTRM